MTTTLDTISQKLSDIRDILDSKIANLTLAPSQIVTPNGLSDIDFRLGIVQAGEFRAGNGLEPNHGFSGVRIGYPPFTYDSEEWNIVGVEDDVLQVGIRASDGKFIAGGGDVIIDTFGISIANSITAQLAFLDNDGNRDTIGIGADPNNDFEFFNLANTPDGTITFFLQDTAGNTRQVVQMLEDPANANVMQVDIQPGAGTTGAKLSMGSEVVIWAGKAGQETVFNGSNRDIDFKIESVLNSSAFVLDAGAEFASFFGDSGINLMVIDNGAEKRIEIGADHYIPLNTSSNPIVIWNEQGLDIDFQIEGDNNPLVLYVDASVDKAVSFAWTGWAQMSHHTWTRTGNHTFTVSGDVTDVYRAGTRVTYTDGSTPEYGVIGSSSHSGGTTTVNLIPNDDYAMANTTIADKYISYIDIPEDFPYWFSYANLISYSASGSMTYTSVSTTYAKWSTAGRLLTVTLLATGTTGGTASNQLRASVPFAVIDTNSYVGAINILDATSGTATIGNGAANGSLGVILARKADSTNYGLGTGRIMQGTVSYPF